LNDMATSYPITFSVNGAQYVAISSGSGNPYSNTWGSLLPEMRRPPGGGSVLWVFRLPGGTLLPSSAEIASRANHPLPAAAAMATTATVTAATGTAAAGTAAAGTAAAGTVADAADKLAPAFFSKVQAQRGAAVYRANCASCHGEGLNDGAFARALRGESFRREWHQKTLGALGQFILLNMPPGKAGQLTRDEYADVLAFLISANGVSAGAADLPADPAAWERLAAPR
jgi:mono/diheme cytochrome c family protein